jgi:predicted nucleic acid-binding protein
VILIDANIFMYAAGQDSPQRNPCQAFLQEVVDGTNAAACTDAEVLQEILHRYRSINRAELGFRIFDSVVALGIPILSVGEDDVRRARRLVQAHPSLSTRDGIHLGVMEARGIVKVLTYDQGFEAVGWATRVEPS